VNVTCFVGIDVSKQTLDLCLVQERGPSPLTTTLHTENSPGGFQRILRWLRQQHASTETTVICLENTGAYDDALLEALTLSGYRCAVEKTTVTEKVRPEHHRKDDAFDAELLAEYARRFTDRLSFYEAPHPVIEAVRVLFNERRRLVEERAATTVRANEGRLRSGVSAFTQTLWQQQLAFFTEQIRHIESEIERLLGSDEDVRHRYEQLKGIDGIGPVTASLWMRLFYGEAHLDARRISSWLGMAPHARRSGTSVQHRARSSGHGLPALRQLLHQCAQSAMTHHEHYRRYKARKLGQGKHPLVVANNAANKLIRVICAVWNQDGSFDRQYVSPLAMLAS